jgi:hypothetical protein
MRAMPSANAEKAGAGNTAAPLHWRVGRRDRASGRGRRPERARPRVAIRARIVGSARRDGRRHGASQPCERNRNENPRRDLRERDRRSPLTTAHVADSQRSYCGPAVRKQALAQDSQRRRSRPPSWIANRALKCAARLRRGGWKWKSSTSVSRALGLVRGKRRIRHAKPH